MFTRKLDFERVKDGPRGREYPVNSCHWVENLVVRRPELISYHPRCSSTGKYQHEGHDGCREEVQCYLVTSMISQGFDNGKGIRMDEALAS
jgi:hypothetical protein